MPGYSDSFDPPVFIAGGGIVPNPMTDTFVASRNSGGSAASRQRIWGVTRNSAGTAIGGCTVDIFDTPTNTLRGSTVSDASGNYVVEVPAGLAASLGVASVTYYAIAYKAGSPDVAGTTVNTMTGTSGPGSL